MNRFQKLQDDIDTWARVEFPDQSLEGIIYHLKDEVGRELLAKPRDLMEYADCFILLIEAAAVAGYSTDDLLDAAEHKLDINRGRTFGTINIKGFAEHVREESE